MPCGLWNQHQSWGEEQFQSERRTPLASDTMPQCWRVSVAKVIVEWNVELLVCCGAQQRRRRGGGRIIQHAQRRPFVHFVFFVELMRFWGYSSYRKNLQLVRKYYLYMFLFFSKGKFNETHKGAYRRKTACMFYLWFQELTKDIPKNTPDAEPTVISVFLESRFNIN